MFYFLLILKLIDKLFLVVVLCEQLKLQAFQTNKKLKHESCYKTKQRLQNESQFMAVI